MNMKVIGNGKTTVGGLKLNILNILNTNNCYVICKLV